MKVPSICTLSLFAIAFLHVSGDVGRADESGVGVSINASITSDVAAAAPTTTAVEAQTTTNSDTGQQQQTAQASSDTAAPVSPTTSSDRNDASSTASVDNNNGHKTTTNEKSQTTQANDSNDSNHKTSTSAAGPTDGPSSSDSNSSQGNPSGSNQKSESGSGSDNNNSGLGTKFIVGAVVGGVAGFAIICTLAVWCIRRGRNNSRTQGFHHQPDDYAINISENDASQGYAGALAKAPFQQQQQARPLIPPCSGGYANQTTAPPYKDYNTYQQYHDKPEERDMGADYHTNPYYYYHDDQTTAPVTAKPDEPMVQQKPNVV